MVEVKSNFHELKQMLCWKKKSW